MGFASQNEAIWAFPVLFESKEDEIMRFCVDYQALNRLTAICYGLSRRNAGIH